MALFVGLFLSWRLIAPGVEYAELTPRPHDRALDGRPRTADAWCRQEHLLAAINLGMFLDDGLSNVGHAQAGARVNQPRWNPKYRSVLAFGPKRPGLPPAALVDLDAPGARARLDEYEDVIQNLRLIRAPGRSVWAEQPRRWSEAAVAIDRAGRVLFVFARAPHSMAEFNRLLLALPLGVVAAMHVEGGPEASLSVPSLGVAANGSYETGFVENDSVARQWPIPNVLGVTAP